MKKRMIIPMMNEYLIGQVNDDESITKIWIRARSEEEAIKDFRWLTNTDVEYVTVIRKRKSFV